MFQTINEQTLRDLILHKVYHRSNTGSIVRDIIEKLNDARLNVTPGYIIAGGMLASIAFNYAPYAAALDTLAAYERVTWRIDAYGRLHFGTALDIDAWIARHPV